MIKRTVELSSESAHLCVERGQLLVVRQGEHKGSVPPGRRIPLEDIGFLVVDERQSTCTFAALGDLVEHGAAVMVCGKNHLPTGLLLPLPAHTETVWRIDAQVSLPVVKRKQLWARIVGAKIRAQALNLPATAPARSRLLAMARRVRSGDAGNSEAVAARVYWQAWLAPDGGTEVRFRRMPGGGDPPNNLLDYGYAVVRAAVARALVAAGLVPALGIHHSNRSNSFALADDLVEPLRPIVDAIARELFCGGATQLDREAKARMLQVLTVPVRRGRHGEEGPLMVAMHGYAASLVRALEGAVDELEIPVLVHGETPGDAARPPLADVTDAEEDDPSRG